MNSLHYIPTEPRFKDLIHSIWQVEGFTDFQQEHIIPKGIVEVIFNFSDGPPIPVSIGNKQYHLSNCFINGFNRTAIKTQLPKQQVFFGIRLQPLAVKKIFKIPACEFSDITVDLSLLDPDFHSLWHQLAEQDHFNKRVPVLLNWFAKNIVEWQPREQLINDFLYANDRRHLSVTQLANSLCYSTRQLSRKIFEITGMNTEEILLYKKYLHAVDLVHHTDMSLTAIAYQSHFSDQSHFIKTFKAYAAITPGEYKRTMSFVKGHIYENVR